VRRIAIEHCEIIDHIGGRDPTTRCLLEEIPAVEEEHAEDRSSLLEGATCRNAGSS
jgi:bacterioferritin